MPVYQTNEPLSDAISKFKLHQGEKVENKTEILDRTEFLRAKTTRIY